MFERTKELLGNARNRVAMAAMPAMAVLGFVQLDATSDAITSWMPVIVTFAMLGIMIKFMNKATQQ